MQQRLEARAFSRIPEHDRRHGLAIDGATPIQDPRTPPRLQLSANIGPLELGPHQGIRIGDQTTGLLQEARHGALAAPDATNQPDHWNFSGGCHCASVYGQRSRKRAFQRRQGVRHQRQGPFLKALQTLNLRPRFHRNRVFHRMLLHAFENGLTSRRFEFGKDWCLMQTSVNAKCRGLWPGWMGGN